MPPIDLDSTDRGRDWIRQRTIDLPGETTEEQFRDFMVAHGITPPKLRKMPLFSPENRARFPWLDRLAGLE